MSGPLGDRIVAVVGFGNQGEAQALNLRDSGVTVLVGARPGRGAEARARALGFPTSDPADAVSRAGIVAMLLPDEAVAPTWGPLAAAWRPDVGLVFAHGFNLLYGRLELPPAGDVVLVSPTGPGRVLRQLYERGEGLPAYVAVHQDRSGAARGLAEAYAGALGCGRAGLWPTTVREETEVDLFGEQVVLCGGMNALVTAAFDTLVERGYSPEIAYLECVHQLTYLADLLHQRGVAGMREAISGTALFGDVTRGPRIVGDAARAEMRQILQEIRSGAFAASWLAEVEAGKPTLRATLEQALAHPIEEARRRALAPGGGGAGPESRKALSKN